MPDVVLRVSSAQFLGTLFDQPREICARRLQRHPAACT
jgi:hypothetical protein